MREGLKIFLSYCLKKGYISKDNYKALQERHTELDKKNKDISLYSLINLELGWDKEKIKSIMKETRDQRIFSSTNLKLPKLPLYGETGAEIPLRRTTKRLTKPDLEKRGMTKRVPRKEREFGKYILVQKLGEGGMGAVYKAYHPGLKTYFALKMILPEKVGEEGKRRFDREARVSFKLKHPNIVQVHDVGVEEGKPYITMDYIRGKDLGKLIRENRFWPRRAFQIILTIARALQYSHDQGIIHRDIKPSNIIIADVDGKETPYLCDFGLASVVMEEGLTRTGQIMGTPYYMSPEQTKGIKMVDAKSDIYSLGVVLYEMLSGKQMIESDRTMAILDEVLHKDPPLISKCVPGIARDVEAITMKCLEKDSSRRYQTAKELGDDIERYLRGENVLARSPGPFYRLWRKIRKNWKTSSAVAGLVLTFIGVLFGWILTSQDQARFQIISLKEQAKDLEKSMNLKGAGEIYLSILKRDQTYEYALNSLASIKRKMEERASEYENSENLKDAIKAYEELKGLDPNHKKAEEGIARIKNKIQALWDEAHQLGEAKLFERASERCRTLINWDPQDERFSPYLIMLTKGKETCRKDARKYYDRAMEVFWNPKLNEAEIKKCNNLFEQAIEIDPAFADAHFQAGRASHRLFDPDKAIEHYKKSLEHDTTLTPAKYYLTASELPFIYEEFHGKNSDDEIISMFDKRFKEIWGETNTTSDIQDPYQFLAKAQLLLNKLVISKNGDKYENTWKDCLNLCNTVIEMSPTFSDAYFLRAQMNSYIVEIRKSASHNIRFHTSPKDLDQALKDCAQGISLDPFRMEFYSLRGTIYQSIGAYDFAEKDYTRALLLKNVPKAEFYRRRALCYVAMKKYKLAEEDLTQNLKFTENAPLVYPRERIDAFMWLAVCKAGLSENRENENKKEAEEYLNKFLSLLKASPSGIIPEAGLLKAMVYLFIDEKFDRAEKEFKEFISNMNKIFNKEKELSLISNILKGAGPFINGITLFIQNAHDLFCAPPELKKYRNNPMVILIFKSDGGAAFGGRYENLDEIHRAIVTQACLETLYKDPSGKKKQERINALFEEQYSPLTGDLFIYGWGYFGEKIYLKILRKLKELPSASLYYRRAVEYYIYNEYEKSRDDLERALELDPNYMEAHYGLSTVYSILSSKKQEYAQDALYHLRRAVECGWSHLEDYTLKDDDFKPLELDKKISPDEFRSWDRLRQENMERINKFKENINELVSMGKITRALRLLYNPKPTFFYQLSKLVRSTEKRVMDLFLNERKNLNGPEIDRKIENLFGEQGKTLWEWTKRGD